MAPSGLPEEHTLSVEINGRRRAILISSPDQLAELAAGWAFAQGFEIDSGTRIELHRGSRSSTASIRLEADAEDRWTDYVVAGFDASLLLPGETGTISDHQGMTEQVFEDLLTMAFDAFRERRGAGGSHNAAIGANSDILSMTTDISRHNAVDKVIGAARLSGTDVSHAALFLSGRISADIAAKAARAGIPIVGSRSIPTVQAAEIAERSGMMFVCRALDNRRFTVGPNRLHS